MASTPRMSPSAAGTTKADPTSVTTVAPRLAATTRFRVGFLTRTHLPKRGGSQTPTGLGENQLGCQLASVRKVAELRGIEAAAGSAGCGGRVHRGLSMSCDSKSAALPEMERRMAWWANLSPINLPKAVLRRSPWMTARLMPCRWRCSRPSTKRLDRTLTDDAMVVLTGRTGIFSAGFDLKVLGGGGPDAGLMLEQGFLLALRLLEHPTPVAIACNGHAVAMGCFLLLSADCRVGVEGIVSLGCQRGRDIGLTMPRSAPSRSVVSGLHPHISNRAVILVESYTPSDSVAAGFLDLVVGEDDLLPAAISLMAEHLSLGLTNAHTQPQRRLRERPP